MYDTLLPKKISNLADAYFALFNHANLLQRTPLSLLNMNII
jgi:hypothetical protein